MKTIRGLNWKQHLPWLAAIAVFDGMIAPGYWLLFTGSGAGRVIAGFFTILAGAFLGQVTGAWYAEARKEFSSRGEG